MKQVFDSVAINLRAVVISESRLIGWPTALFSVQPKSFRTESIFQIGHPRRSNINDTSNRSCIWNKKKC
jgi:hypothetical protein